MPTPNREGVVIAGSLLYLHSKLMKLRMQVQFVLGGQLRCRMSRGTSATVKASIVGSLAPIVQASLVLLKKELTVDDVKAFALAQLVNSLNLLPPLISVPQTLSNPAK